MLGWTTTCVLVAGSIYNVALLARPHRVVASFAPCLRVLSAAGGAAVTALAVPIVALSTVAYIGH